MLVTWAQVLHSRRGSQLSASPPFACAQAMQGSAFSVPSAERCRHDRQVQALAAGGAGKVSTSARPSPLSAGLSGVTSSRRCCRSSAVIGRRLISLPVTESHHTTSIVVRSSKRSQETVSNRLPERYSAAASAALETERSMRAL